MKTLVCAVAAFAIAGSAAAYAQTPAAGNACLQPARMEGWNVVDDRTVIVTDYTHRKFKVNLAPGCFNLKFAFGLGFKTFGGSRLSCLSKGDSIRAPIEPGLHRQNCLIVNVEAYTPDMAHADAVDKAVNSPH